MGKPFEASSATPTLLSFGNISTEVSHESINYLSSDNTQIFFSRSDKDFNTSTLYMSIFSKGAWGNPEVLPFSGTHYDANIQFSPNEDKAFFTSKRKSTNPELSLEWNIWQVDADNRFQYAEPQILPYPINSSGSECCLIMNKNGLTFFASSRDGSWDIYSANYAKGKFTDVQKLSDIINSEKGEWPGYINEKGDILLISSIRNQGYGGDDIYLVRKLQNQWSTPILLDSIVNTSSYEDNPLISADGNYFLFSSQKKNRLSQGVSNIYYMKHSEIETKK